MYFLVKSHRFPLEDNNIDPMRHCTISFDENDEGEVIPKIIKKKTVKSNSSLTSLKKKKKRKIVFDDYDDHKGQKISKGNSGFLNFQKKSLVFAQAYKKWSNQKPPIRF